MAASSSIESAVIKMICEITFAADDKLALEQNIKMDWAAYVTWLSINIIGMVI